MVSLISRVLGISAFLGSAQTLTASPTAAAAPTQRKHQLLHQLDDAALKIAEVARNGGSAV